MRAVVLAGGLGTRLRPYTTILPKPLLPIGDRPVLELILRRLSAADVRKVDLCLGHLGELIRTYFSEGTTLPEGLELAWHWEDEPLGTAGALRLVPDLDRPFIAMNGDVLTTLDFRAVLEHHEQSGAILTIAMHSAQVDIDLGVLEHRDGFLNSYSEKPTLHYDVSMGVYVYDPAALDLMPPGFCQFPDLVVRLLEAGHKVATFASDAEWFDIGTFSEYERALRHLAGGEATFASDSAKR